MDRNEIKQLLEPYDLPHLECDGATRVFVWLLREAEIPHIIKAGQLEVDGSATLWPHYWIELDDSGLIVDFKARRWLGESPDVPHGVFLLEEFPKALYVGDESRMLITKTIFDILTRPPGD
jgi:hypothetical protein